ncbi:MAG: DUF3847 domain-containing protein, partial [Oscillospiraceae bacterium]|nr:DUF3847 domain-containing protein [Oscillospiraceae bacterium]
PKLEKLYAEQERVEQELEQTQHQQQRLENRIRYISKTERKARNHKLITRGATVEHLWPQVKPMTEVGVKMIERHQGSPSVFGRCASRIVLASGSASTASMSS